MRLHRIGVQACDCKHTSIITVFDSGNCKPLILIPLLIFEYTPASRDMKIYVILHKRGSLINKEYVGYTMAHR